MARVKKGGHHPPREGFWFAEPLPGDTIPDPSDLRPTLIVLAVLLTLGALTFGNMGVVDVRLAVGCVGLVVFAYQALTKGRVRLAMRRLQREVSGDERFRDRPYEPGEHPAVVAVLVDGEPIGADRGILRLADGLLAFHGGATSFALAAWDVTRRSRLSPNDPYGGLPDDALRLAVRGQNVAIRMVGLHGHDAALAREVSTFLHRTKGTAEPRQWPPTHPYAAPEPTPVPFALLSRLTERLSPEELLERAHAALEAGHFGSYAELQDAALSREEDATL